MRKIIEKKASKTFSLLRITSAGLFFPLFASCNSYSSIIGCYCAEETNSADVTILSQLEIFPDSTALVSWCIDDDFYSLSFFSIQEMSKDTFHLTPLLNNQYNENSMFPVVIGHLKEKQESSNGIKMHFYGLSPNYIWSVVCMDKDSSYLIDETNQTVTVNHCDNYSLCGVWSCNNVLPVHDTILSMPFAIGDECCEYNVSISPLFKNMAFYRYITPDVLVAVDSRTVKMVYRNRLIKKKKKKRINIDKLCMK